ncbi:SufE family protein [Pseudidiomarina sp. PP-1MA]|uniref:SufE family protein n=1 Tax=Pseudidiomarina sp. PP-1MA TaxID=3237706 RepID=A0AB39XAM2_9GAMM
MYGILSESDLKQLATSFVKPDQRLRELVLLAKQTPLTSALQQPQFEVFGCEAKVWLQCQWLASTSGPATPTAAPQTASLQLELGSESRTVHGLLQLIKQALQGASPTQLEAFDLVAYLRALHLDDYISESRRDGLQAVVAAIKGKA